MIMVAKKFPKTNFEQPHLVSFFAAHGHAVQILLVRARL